MFIRIYLSKKHHNEKYIESLSAHKQLIYGFIDGVFFGVCMFALVVLITYAIDLFRMGIIKGVLG